MAQTFSDMLRLYYPLPNKYWLHDASRWDDWVLQDRVRKFTDDNKELAAQLHNQMKAMKSGQQKAASNKSAKKSAVGRGALNCSDLSSSRGSEERNSNSFGASQSARGPRRNRDYDLESVS